MRGWGNAGKTTDETICSILTMYCQCSLTVENGVAGVDEVSQGPSHLIGDYRHGTEGIPGRRMRYIQIIPLRQAGLQSPQGRIQVRPRSDLEERRHEDAARQPVFEVLPGSEM